MSKKKSKNNSKIKKIKIWFRKNKLQFNFSEMMTITVLAIMIGFLIGSSSSYNNSDISFNKNSAELEELVSTYNNLYNNYYQKVGEKTLVNAAIKGMVSSLDDPYSEMLENSDSETFNEKVDGEYVGIGATVQYDGEHVSIIEISKSSPAEKAGLKVNDELLEVDGKSILNMELSKISNLIKGKSGTNVKLKIKRDDKEEEITIKRGKVVIPSVSSKVIKKNDKKVGYISIGIFSANTAKQFEKHLKKLESKNIDSLIIDVRSNPGGHLLQVTDIIELFTKKNQVIYRIEKKNVVKKIKDKTTTSRDYDIVVLINSESASASEILASAMKETYKAKLVGTTTYGKGSVQTAYTLESGSTLKYTIQSWLTAKGNSINKVGVKPNYEVKLDDKYYENPTEENDNQLNKALELLTNKEEKTK